MQEILDKEIEEIEEEIDSFKDIKKSNIKKLWILFFQGAIFSLSSALLSYILSSYLEKFINQNLISFVYLLPNIISIFVIIGFGKIIKRAGLFKVCLINSIILFGTLLSQVFIQNNIFLIIATIILYQISGALVWIFIDFYVEKFSDKDSTGNIKGLQWTIMNGTFLLGPLSAGFIVSKLGFDWVFLISSLITIPAIISFIINFKDIKINHAKHVGVNIKKIYKQKPIFKISMISFLLNLFYCWMTIYTPIYMNKELGLSWDKIGIIIAIILIPFVILQYPAGKLADKYLGEKELLMTSVIIMGVSTLLLFFVNNVIGFTLVLFATRIGASILEIMRETYLYKNLKLKDVDLLSFFKTMSPLAWVIGPTLSGILLIFINIKSLYLLLGLIILIAGIGILWNLKDTKVNFKSKYIEM